MLTHEILIATHPVQCSAMQQSTCLRNPLHTDTTSDTSVPGFTLGVGPNMSITICRPLNCSDHFSSAYKEI